MLTAGRRPLPFKNHHYWWILGQGLWTRVQVSVCRLATCRITKKTEVPSKSFPHEDNGDCCIWCQENDCVPLYSTWQNSDSSFSINLLLRKVCRVIREKHLNLVNRAVILHYSARPLAAGCVWRLLYCGMESIGAPTILSILISMSFFLDTKSKGTITW